MKSLIGWILSSLLCLAGAAAFAAEPGGALVTQVQGKAMLAGKDGKPAPLPAFMKLHPGDQLILEAGAKVQIVYLSGGRQETWKDAARAEIGATESKPLAPGAVPEVKHLPPFLVQTLTKSPDVMAGIQNRQGMVRLRAVAADGRLTQAWKQYDELRRAAADDDITPELHLLVTLQELKAFADIKEVLAEMLRRQPDNAEVKALNERYIGPAAKS